jgi:hypothetical protein
MLVRVLAGVAGVILAGVPLKAHDFWLIASPWVPASSVAISAHVGERFPYGTDFTTPTIVQEWRVLGPDGDISAARTFRRDGAALSADVPLASAGVFMATMTIAAHVVKMEGPAFTSYLHEEGLDRIIASRQQAGESWQPARERYTRYAKVVVRNGGGSGAHVTRPVGLPVEFVPMTDPTTLSAGGLLTLQLLSHGKPVAGAEVTARPSTGGHPSMGRTDATGNVTLPIDREGAWMVRTVHMVTGAEAGIPDVDWDSYWTTLVFHTANR